ncbi:MAG: [NiFe]-hydrogenase assembly chaperone HybE [Zoogloeaceae bacterium]|jgi:[NiFe] hydrogenase assembly HybE family chaperone|nr:[NiFe]-hydrogenase assembly chaperone HybE [Zoogloeaceae bacterium]
MPENSPTQLTETQIAAQIEAAFRQIAETRMRDLPFLNPRLSVETVGFRPWQQSWIGVLITPWGINLLQLPVAEAPFPPVRADAQIEVALPGGVMPFMPAHEARFGDYRLCSLFSPAQEFADQDTARAAAIAVLALLFEDNAASRQAQNGNKPNLSRRRLFGLSTS